MDFRLCQLRSLITLAETLNYAKASRVLFMAQPTLSVQIKSLEEDFQVKLFDRSRQKVQLTEAGRHLVDLAKQILQDVERARIQMSKMEASKPLRVCSSQAGNYEVLPKLIRQMSDRFPDTQLEFQSMVPAERIEALRSHKVDVLVMVSPMYGEGISFELLRTESMVAIVPDREPYRSMEEISIYDFANQPLLTVSDRECSHCRQFNIDLLARFGLQAELVEAPIDSNAQMAMIAGGKAVGFSGESSENVRFPGIIRLPFKERVPCSKLGVAWRTGDDSPVLRSFIAELRKVAYRPFDVTEQDDFVTIAKLTAQPAMYPIDKVRTAF